MEQNIKEQFKSKIGHFTYHTYMVTVYCIKINKLIFF